METYLSCAMDIGEQMLLSGAEVHRVEESVRRICSAFGAVRTDVFIITSSMVVTCFDAAGNSYTQTRRINGASTDFNKLHQLNKLSRKICSSHPPLEQILQDLAVAMQGKTYPFWMEVAAYAVIAGAFTLFFGGSVTEMLISLCVGALVRLGIVISDKITANRIFSKFISATLATALALLAVRLGWIDGMDKIIIGNIMTLIPGIGLTNSLRDLFVGDSIAGLLRAIEAVLTGLALAAGYFLVAFIGGIAL